MSSCQVESSSLVILVCRSLLHRIAVFKRPAVLFRIAIQPSSKWCTGYKLVICPNQNVISRTISICIQRVSRYSNPSHVSCHFERPTTKKCTCCWRTKNTTFVEPRSKVPISILMVSHHVQSNSILQRGKLCIHWSKSCLHMKKTKWFHSTILS